MLKFRRGQGIGNKDKKWIERENGIRIEEKDVNRDQRGQEKELEERMEKGIGEKDGKRDRREKR
jgi:hypothetical protein